jgi:hypothetical protein
MRRLIIGILAMAALCGAQQMEAVWKRFPWKDVKGTLSFSEEGIRFDAAKKKYSFDLPYTGVQQFDRQDANTIRILTYKDRWQYGWADQEYTLRLEPEALSDDLWRTLVERLPTPVVDRSGEALGAVEYRVPVKHLHRFGGCDGVLRFTREGIAFQSEDAEDSRRWRFGDEIAGVWSDGPYELEISAFEHTRAQPGDRRPFRFQLKRKLDEAYLDSLKYRLYAIERSAVYPGLKDSERPE